MEKELAIQGHTTRGREVIELLEMMGGKNIYKNDGGSNSYSYYLCNYAILSNRSLSIAENDDFEIFTLEDFLKKYPYKVGDKVHIYVQTDDFDGMCDVKVTEITSMRWNPVMCKIAYKMKNINREFYKEEIKCKVDDDSNNTSKDMEENKVDLTLKVKGESYYGNCISYQIPDGYEVSKIENDEIILQKKKPKYPNTYEECCVALEYIPHTDNVIGYKWDILQSLQKLIICRDAYWKIAGKELGLGKPWEPDFDNDNEYKYGIFRLRNIIYKDATCINPRLLVFPTIEMRDAFKKNFDPDIEICKELL